MVPPVDSLGVLVEVVIITTDGTPVEKYRLSPEKLGMKNQVEGNMLAFSMNSYAYVIAQLSDLREIVILCDPAEIVIQQRQTFLHHQGWGYTIFWIPLMEQIGKSLCMLL